MGYTTDFAGKWTVSPQLKPEHAAYLKKFAETRRMERNEVKTRAKPDPIRQAAGLPVGEWGAYFVGSEAFGGQDFDDESVTSSKCPPPGQPGLWCQWVPTSDGNGITWDGGEKFYDYQEWLQYLIDHFLEPWGYTLNGDVKWQGEQGDDAGVIRVTDNKIKIGTYERTLRWEAK
jgi:hypothetical protein